MDNSCRIWDIRPYPQTPDRSLQVVTGHRHGADKNLLQVSWSPDCKYLTCGSADMLVHVWDVESGQEIYTLPGHKGTVNDVQFHPTSSDSNYILASVSSDKTIFLGELI